MFTSETQLKMTLFQADLDERFQSAEHWAVLCEKAVEEGSAHDAFDSFIGRYRKSINAGDHDGLVEDLRTDMLDNYIVGAFAAKLIGIPAGLPMIAWSAANKHEFPGWHGDIATIRTLLWAGFDPSAQDSIGATGLHYMVNMKYGKGCNPRAVRDLLDAGADPTIAHNSGDTPLHTLCGHMNWTDEHTECFIMLVNAGASILAKANDGSTPISLLMHCEQESPGPERAKLLAYLNAAMSSEDNSEGDSKEPAANAEPTPQQPTPDHDHMASSSAPDVANAEPGEIPPELLIAAKEYYAKGGSLGGLGRWLFKEDPKRPEQLAEMQREWALKKMGTKEGDKLIAEIRARQAKGS